MAKIEKHDELLPCDLDIDEVNAKAKEVAILFEDLAQLAGKRDAAKKEADGEIKTAEERQRGLAREVRDGVEYRNVPCRDEPDWESKKMRTSRDDTGELVRDRNLTQTELQRKLDFDATKGANEAAEAAKGGSTKGKARRRKKGSTPKGPAPDQPSA